MQFLLRLLSSVLFLYFTRKPLWCSWKQLDNIYTSQKKRGLRILSRVLIHKLLHEIDREIIWKFCIWIIVTRLPNLTVDKLFPKGELRNNSLVSALSRGIRCCAGGFSKTPKIHRSSSSGCQVGFFSVKRANFLSQLENIKWGSVTPIFPRDNSKALLKLGSS